jgi:hypothetical protein
MVRYNLSDFHSKVAIIIPELKEYEVYWLDTENALLRNISFHPEINYRKVPGAAIATMEAHVLKDLQFKYDEGCTKTIDHCPFIVIEQLKED